MRLDYCHFKIKRIGNTRKAVNVSLILTRTEKYRRIKWNLQTATHGNAVLIRRGSILLRNVKKILSAKRCYDWWTVVVAHIGSTQWKSIKQYNTRRHCWPLQCLDAVLSIVSVVRSVKFKKKEQENALCSNVKKVLNIRNNYTAGQWARAWVSCAKTAEPIEMPFGLKTHV